MHKMIQTGTTPSLKPQTQQAHTSHYKLNQPPQTANPPPKSEADDDDYWASYDRTPSRTPAPQKPAPLTTTQPSAAGTHHRTPSELDYYSRYGTEVQPALDAHDPDEVDPNLGESTLNGDALSNLPPQTQQQQQPEGRASRPNGTSLFPASSPPRHLNPVTAPEPISPTSSHGSSIARLESKAAEMSEALALTSGGESSSKPQRGSDRARIAVQQHISTDVKSLFRLAKSSGMEREEFERIVRTELDVLGMMEVDD